MGRRGKPELPKPSDPFPKSPAPDPAPAPAPGGGNSFQQEVGGPSVTNHFSFHVASAVASAEELVRKAAPLIAKAVQSTVPPPPPPARPRTLEDVQDTSFLDT
jgi:hypothetical protein